MNLNKQKAFLIHFLFIAIVLGLIYISLKYLMPLLTPFLIGLVVAAVFRRTIDVIAAKTHIKRSFVSILVLLVFYSTIAFLAILVGAKVFAFLKDLFYQMPDIYRNAIEPSMNTVTQNLLIKFPDIEIYLQDIFNSINQSLFSFVSKASTTVVSAITGFAGQVPTMLINFLFTLVASFFFTIDYHRIANFVLKQFSKEKRVMILNVKDNVIGTLGKFFKAYATLITITFIELSIGFLILRIPNSFLIAFVVAVVDILPILGTGAVLIPWTIIAFIFGENSMGIGILIIYIIVTIVRQTLEPKIVGQQIGLHPIVTLICMYVGTSLFGVAGLLLFPITATIIKKMNDEGTIHLFKL